MELAPLGSPASPEPEPTRSCLYCDTQHRESLYDAHLVAEHADLLFHCDECNTYVDKKDFLLHMSLHAVEYANNEKKTAAKRSRKIRRKRAEKPKVVADEIVADSRKSKTPERTIEIEIQVNDPPPNEVKETQENEFSDHSDTEYGFGPLPESVFEAIEDSQDSQPLPENDDEARSSYTPDVADITSDCDVSNEVEPEKEKEASPPTQPNKIESHKKPRTCPICAKVYNASSSYFYHMKYFHKRSKEHECEICGKKFGTKGSLAEHSTIHTGECRYECKSCNKKFRSKASLYIHEQSHNGIKTWACTQCSRSFRWRTHLLRHMKRHSAEKAHVCTTCGRGFNIRCDLLRHTQTHTAGSFACDLCDVKFAQLRYLKVHKDKKHATPNVIES